MGIPESQLDTWSHQGSIAQSASTYSIIKNALESANTKYHGKNFKVFLQGSYGNDTNIYAESDVDVVICLDDVYYSDLTQLSPEDKDAYDRAGNDSNLLIVFYVQIMPDDFVMQLHRF
ncbi:nucleotidyltransferase domain-containing protein [Klebsiella pneumoniae]